MNVFWIIFYLVLGLLLLIKSADYFVDSAVKIAEISGIPKLIIGATIVSLATTLPELFVSTQSLLAGSNEMAVGNAIGSVMFNTAIILSIAAIYMSGKVDRKNVMEKSIVLVLSLVTLFIFAWDLKITLVEGIIQLSFIVLYTYLNIRAVKKQKNDNEPLDIPNRGSIILWRSLILIASAMGIYFGSQFLVKGATAIATGAGVSEDVIGLTILAMGTSLPELTTTITSVIKKQQSLSVGNILGANILNLTLIMGTCGVLGNALGKGGLVIGQRSIWPFNTVVPQTLYVDLPVVLLVILLFVIPIFINGKLKKWQGFVGLGIYLVYLAFLLINVS